MRLKKSTTSMSGVCQMATVLSQGTKQSGRRFGPAPTKVLPWSPVERVTPPMDTERREEAYRRQSGRKRRPQTRYDDAGAPQAYARINGLTPRQRRRSWHKALTAARVEGDRALALAVDKELEALGAAPVQRERKAAA